MKRPPVRSCLFAILALLLTGCVPYGGIVWSPDGSRAAYTDPDGVGHLLDRNGKMTADLGKAAVGGFSWTDDGKALYFIRVDKTKFANVAKTSQGKEVPNVAEPDTLCRWNDGKIDPVFQLDGMMTTAVSPGGRWIAVTGVLDRNARVDGHYTGSIRVWDTVGHHLYPLCDRCDFGMTFTGPDKIAVVETDEHQPAGPDGNNLPLLGKLVEFDLTPLPTGKPVGRTVLVDAPCAGPQLPVGDGKGDPLFFEVSSAGRATTAPSSPVPTASLCRFDVKTRKTVRLTDAPAIWATLSPDGTKVLVLVEAPPEKGGGLRLVDANGKHNVAVTPEFERMGILPVWHGNDRITFNSLTGVQLPIDPGFGGSHTAVDVVDYQPLPAGKLVPDKVLSADWPVGLKPLDQAVAPQPTTRP